jgi:hypothetical protein
MKIALIDASSAILLYKANLFQEMSRTYDLCMVPTVFKEITVEGRIGADAFHIAKKMGNIQLITPGETDRWDPLFPSLHPGETETLMAYDDGKTDFIIIDDGRGARTCRFKKIPYINALLCPYILYLSGAIDNASYSAAFDRLLQIGRYGQSVVNYARKSTREGLARFMP